MRRALWLVVSVALGVTSATPALADDDVSVGATFYYDYFVDFTKDADQGDDATRGFDLRRVYLTVKKSWGDVSFRSTTDIDYKFETGNLNVYSKYAYLEHKGLVPDAKVLVGQHSPNTHSWVEKRWHYVRQDGPEVFKFASSSMAAACAELLERNGLSGDDVHLLVPHQANKRITAGIEKALRLPKGRVIDIIECYGNVSASTVPIALDEVLKGVHGPLPERANIVLTAVGGGYTSGGAVIEWTGGASA